MIYGIDKENARTAVRKAVYHGQLVKPKACEECNTTRYIFLSAHHPDYNYPLDVVWLCTLCHKHEHMRLAKQNKLALDNIYNYAVVVAKAL